MLEAVLAIGVGPAIIAVALVRSRPFRLGYWLLAVGGFALFTADLWLAAAWHPVKNPAPMLVLAGSLSLAIATFGLSKYYGKG